LFGFGDELDDVGRLVCDEKGVAQFDVAKDAAEAGEHGEVVGEVGRGKQEEEADGFIIDRAEWNAGNVAAE
jgi:hypothetical protein